jgi:hypothetical protein
MDEAALKERAQSLCDALVTGDIELATQDFSEELRRNLGEVLSLLPLPANTASVDSVDHTGSGYNVVLRLVGETEEVLIQTRWKDRDGRPTLIEASHLAKTEIAGQPDTGADEGEAQGDVNGA